MSRERTYVWTLVCLAALLAVHASALFALAGEDPCADDVKKLCVSVPTGSGRVFQCLQSHEDDLAFACRQKVQAIRGRMKDVAAECADDVDRFCSEVEPGGNRIVECLLTNANQLSMGCKEPISKLKSAPAETRKVQDEKRAEIRRACDYDLRKFCEDINVDYQLSCLDRHRSELSQMCAAAMPKVP